MKYILLTLILTVTSCANVVAPTGGPKDETPPKLLSTIPLQDQTSYKGSQIMLEFDEYLKLENAKDEIIITPTVAEPKFSVKKNIVSIEFQEPLADSTTYNISFRESIQDLNEGNSAEDLHLAFSTGPYIDSLRISGRVTQLLKGLPAAKFTVALYQADTFDIFKHRPVYFTQSNKDGVFTLQNLKAGDYEIYAFEDKNKNLVLESKSERYAFSQKVNLPDVTDSIQLQAIALDARPITLTGIRAMGYLTKVRLNKNLSTYSIQSLDSTAERILSCFAASQSEIDIFPVTPPGDSTRVKLTGIDSLQQRIDTIFYLKQTDAKGIKEKIKVTPGKIVFSEDSHTLTADIATSELIKSVLPDSIYIAIDTTIHISFQQSEIKFDTIFRRVLLQKVFKPTDSLNWKKAKFTLAGMAFTSIHGDSTVKITAPIATLLTAETAILVLEIETGNPNLLIQVLDGKYQSLGIYPAAKDLVIRALKPEPIQLRSIDDTNHNGTWDPGNPLLNIPPEGIQFFRNPDGSKTVPLRANWEVNLKWKL